MEQEQPITPDMTAALVAQLQHAIDSGARTATVGFLGTPLQFERDDAGRMTLGMPGHAERMQVFAAQPARPDGYPEHLPFVTDELVCAASRWVNWWSPRDPHRVLAEVDAQLLADGWVPHEPPPHAMMAPGAILYRKGALKRIVSTASGIISVIEAP